MSEAILVDTSLESQGKISNRCSLRFDRKIWRVASTQPMLV